MKQLVERLATRADGEVLENDSLAPQSLRAESLAQIHCGKSTAWYTPRICGYRIALWRACTRAEPLRPLGVACFLWTRCLRRMEGGVVRFHECAIVWRGEAGEFTAHQGTQCVARVLADSHFYRVGRGQAEVRLGRTGHLVRMHLPGLPMFAASTDIVGEVGRENALLRFAAADGEKHPAPTREFSGSLQRMRRLFQPVRRDNLFDRSVRAGGNALFRDVAVPNWLDDSDWPTMVALAAWGRSILAGLN